MKKKRSQRFNPEEIKNYNGEEFRDRPRKRKVYKKKHYLLKFTIFVIVCVALFFFLNSSFFNIGTIDVKNSNYYSEEDVLTIANVKEGVNIFLGIDKGDIVNRLEKNPYFVDVDVIRKFPNFLVIDVHERKQIAAIEYGNQYIVIDSNGIILRKTDIEPKLTILEGLTISKLKIGSAVEAEEKANLRNTLKMLSVMESSDIFFKKISMSKVLIRGYIYDQLICQGTPKEMLNAIEKGNLQKVLNKLFKNDTKRGTIILGGDENVSFSPEL